MGIIEDYLNEDKKEAGPAVKSGIIQQYLDAGDRPKVIIQTPKPPISGVTAEQSNTINAVDTPNSTSGPNTRSLSDIPVNAGRATYDAAKEGILTAGSGIGDILSNQPASGFGKIGVGGLSALTSPIAGVEQLAGDVTGSKDIADRAGMVLGAIPVAPVANLGVQSLKNLSLPTTVISKNKALHELVEKITSNGREPENLVNTINAMKANPRIGPADTSPAVLNMAQKLFTTEGDYTKNYLHTTSTNRIKSSADTVNSAFDTAAGLSVNAVNKLKELAEASKKVGNEQINPAIAGSKPVDLTGTLEHIDSRLKPGVNSVISGESSLPTNEAKAALSNFRKLLASPTEMRTGAQDLHDLQSSLRIHAERLLGSATGSDRSLGHALMEVRNKLVGDIDKASGGKYKPALSNYRDEKQISEAFYDAYNGILTNSKKLENRPEFTEEWFKGLTEHEKQAAIEGIRTKIDTEMGVAKNPALAGTSLGKSAFNQKKMEAVLGKEETHKLLNTLEAERSISNTHNKILEGSQTEMRHAGDDAIALSKNNPNKANPLSKYVLPAAAGLAEAGSSYFGAVGLGSLAVGGLAGATKLGSMGKNKIIDILEKERNAQLAKFSLPTQGPDRDALIKSLEAAIPGPKKSLVSKANSLARLVGP